MKNRADNLVMVYGISKVFPQDSKTFKEIQLQNVIRFPDEKPNAEQILSVSSNVGITESHVVATPSGHSCEGQILTGKKLVIEGKVCVKAEYIAELKPQPIHGAQFYLPFSTYIVLGKEIDYYPCFEVSGYIEDIHVRQLDQRSIYINHLFLLNAFPLLKN